MATPHLTPDEFRRLGREVVDWVADYWERVAELPVTSDTAPGDTYHALAATLPDAPEPFAAVLGDLDEHIVPALTHWQHPSFFAYFPCNTSGPAVLADIVSSGLGVNGMNWATGPAVTELELLVLDWFVDLLGLPAHFRNGDPGTGGGVLQDSASSATLVSLLAARHRVGAAGDLSKLRAYTSAQAHSSIVKGARIAGLADEQVRLIDTDETFAMRPDRLAAAVAADVTDGLVPFFCCATVGTTSSMAFDPVVAIADVLEGHEVWLHVDAAMAGSAAVCEEFRWVTDGSDRADSWSFNPHKWLFTTFDCTCLWVADRHALIDALTITPAYLRNSGDLGEEVVDYRDWQIPLGRRFRALKPWFVLRHYGRNGLGDHLRAHVDLARSFADRVLAEPRLTLAAPPALNLVCVRVTAGHEATRALAAGLNATREVLVTPTELDGRPAIRVCVGQTMTEARHVDRLWELIQRLLDDHG